MFLTYLSFATVFCAAVGTIVFIFFFTFLFFFYLLLEIFYTFIYISTLMGLRGSVTFKWDNFYLYIFIFQIVIFKALKSRVKTKFFLNVT